MTAPAPDAIQLTDIELYRMPDAVRLLKLSRSEIYELIRAGRLASVKQGRARLFTADDFREYITLLKKEAEVAA